MLCVMILDMMKVLHYEFNYGNRMNFSMIFSLFKDAHICVGPHIVFSIKFFYLDYCISSVFSEYFPLYLALFNCCSYTTKHPWYIRQTQILV